MVFYRLTSNSVDSGSTVHRLQKKQSQEFAHPNGKKP